MAAKRTGLHIDLCSRKDLQKTVDKIKELIPVGMNWHKEAQPGIPDPPFESDDPNFVVNHVAGKSALQLGTLGGGNHFIEIQTDTRGYIWIMIHSGSRNLGKQVADIYNKELRKTGCGYI
jgi:tRNA-splicing ligase RtcB